MQWCAPNADGPMNFTALDSKHGYSFVVTQRAAFCHGTRLAPRIETRIGRDVVVRRLARARTARALRDFHRDRIREYLEQPLKLVL